MTEKGICQKHGEFDLRKGCPDCIAEKQGETVGGTALLDWVDLKMPTTAMVKIAPEEDEAIKGIISSAQIALIIAEERLIKTAEDLKLATDDLDRIAGLKKALIAKQGEYTNPLKDYKDAILATFKEMLTPIIEADHIIREKMLAYNREQERIRQEQEAINRLKMEAAKKEMELNGELSESVDLVEVLPEAPTTVRGDIGMAGQSDHWKYEVIDFALLPDEFKVADTAMLNAIAKKHHDKKQIPGVRFFNEPIIARRAK